MRSAWQGTEVKTSGKDMDTHVGSCGHAGPAPVTVG
jgi:hypothetical protein